jgi:arylsulfatase A-like enzyme
VRWGKGVNNPGRVLDDFVSLTDLAPTFLELAGEEVPAEMTGRSLVPLLESPGEGLVDASNRSYVFHGKERHVPGQEGHLGGYPVRAVRSHDFLYIRNFEPDRWPSGTPDYLEAEIPYCWLGDCDNGPTKTYMVDARDRDEQHRRLYDLAFAKRPPEELYDCRNDPGQLMNLAGRPEYEVVRKEMSARLMKELEETGDPRAVGGAELFDRVPYLGQGPRHPSYRPGEE